MERPQILRLTAQYKFSTNCWHHFWAENGMGARVTNPIFPTCLVLISNQWYFCKEIFHYYVKKVPSSESFLHFPKYSYESKIRNSFFVNDILHSSQTWTNTRHKFLKIEINVSSEFEFLKIHLNKILCEFRFSIGWRYAVYYSIVHNRLIHNRCPCSWMVVYFKIYRGEGTHTIRILSAKDKKNPHF